VSYSRFAIGFTRNRKVFALSDAAFRLYVSAIDWAREQKTNGVVVDTDLPAIARLPKRWGPVVDELVNQDLWEVTLLGWQIHDFLIWQDSAQQVNEKQARARERMRRVRANSERTDDARSREVLPGVPSLSGSDLIPSEADPDPDLPKSFSQVGPEQRGSSVAPAEAPKKSGGIKRRWRKPPADFKPNDGHRELAKSLGVSLSVELPKFLDHEYRDAKSDADACFRTWIRTASEYQARFGKAPGAIQHETHTPHERRPESRRLDLPERRGGVGLAFGGTKT
jgi:hypothetical protein